MNPNLHELASLYSIQTSYDDVWERRRVASDESIAAVLERRGVGASSARQIEDSLATRREALAASRVEAVIVAWGGALEFSLPSGWSEADLQLTLEGGDTIEQRITRGDDHGLGRLPFGYHRLVVRSRGAEYRSTILSAPETTWQGESGPLFGLFAPLYSLRSRRDWGCGDFTDASRFVSWAEKQGACFVGVLPLLASNLRAPFDPSPYAPVSRLFWNELFIDPERVPELAQSPEAQDLLANGRFRAEIERLRRSELIDYRGVYAAKRRVLDELARTFFSGATPSRLDAFEQFRRSNPLLDDYVAFRAATERQLTGFRFWHERLVPPIPESQYDDSVAHLHAYAQFVADEQLSEVAQAGGSCGLYLDFPLGTNRDGFDVWRFPHLFAPNSAIGAPPDFAYATGQNWGFPPLDPDAIRDDGYRLFASCIRHHMSRAGLLRIDHVMSLHRLYWIADGFDPTDGVYVRYRDEELYAVLCIESHRARCTVIGEDLGTVPPNVRDAMDRRQLRRLFVLQRQLLHAKQPPGEVLPNMAASLNNHDMPPFAGFWNGRDIEEREQLGMYDFSRAAAEREKRERVRSVLTAMLRNAGDIRTDATGEMVRGAHRWLARSDAGIMLISLEDLWGEVESQNVPTTTTERPNWRRRFALTLEEIESSKQIEEDLADVRAARLRSSGA